MIEQKSTSLIDQYYSQFLSIIHSATKKLDINTVSNDKERDKLWYLTALMVSSKNGNSLRITNLEGHQKLFM